MYVGGTFHADFHNADTNFLLLLPFCPNASSIVRALCWWEHVEFKTFMKVINNVSAECVCEFIFVCVVDWKGYFIFIISLPVLDDDDNFWKDSFFIIIKAIFSLSNDHVDAFGGL